MGNYRLTWKGIYSQNIGIDYHTYHGITFPWLATSHRTPFNHTYHGISLLWFAVFHDTYLPWIVSPLVHICVAFLNTLLWARYERVIGSILDHACILGFLQDYLNLSPEFPEGSPLQWFGKVVGQYFPCWAIFDVLFPRFYSICNQEVSDAYVFCPILTW